MSQQFDMSEKELSSNDITISVFFLFHTCHGYQLNVFYWNWSLLTIIIALYGHFHWQWSSGQVVKLGWSNTEDLLCVQDDGVVLTYDMFLNFKRTFGMGQVSFMPYQRVHHCM